MLAIPNQAINISISSYDTSRHATYLENASDNVWPTCRCGASVEETKKPWLGREEYIPVKVMACGTSASVKD